jgi:hypothetical protein
MTPDSLVGLNLRAHEPLVRTLYVRTARGGVARPRSLALYTAVMKRIRGEVLSLHPRCVPIVGSARANRADPSRGPGQLGHPCLRHVRVPTPVGDKVNRYVSQFRRNQR